MVNPTSDVSMEALDSMAHILRKPAEACEKFKEENPNYDILKNKDCVDIAQLQSNFLFEMPKVSKLDYSFLKFFATIIKDIGSIKYRLKFSDLIPNSLMPLRYKRFISASNVNRILSPKKSGHMKNSSSVKVPKNKENMSDSQKKSNHALRKATTIRGYIKNKWVLNFIHQEGDAKDSSESTAAKKKDAEASKRDLQSAEPSPAATPAPAAEQKPSLSLSSYDNGGFTN